MSTRAAVALALLLPIGLSGCAGPPWAQAVSPDGITLRWYPNDAGEFAAQQIADAHCEPTGQPAAMHAIEEDPGAIIATYRCR